MTESLTYRTISPAYTNGVDDASIGLDSTQLPESCVRPRNRELMRLVIQSRTGIQGIPCSRRLWGNAHSPSRLRTVCRDQSRSAGSTDRQGCAIAGAHPASRARSASVGPSPTPARLPALRVTSGTHPGENAAGKRRAVDQHEGKNPRGVARDTAGILTPRDSRRGDQLLRWRTPPAFRWSRVGRAGGCAGVEVAHRQQRNVLRHVVESAGQPIERHPMAIEQILPRPCPCPPHRELQTSPGRIGRAFALGISLAACSVRSSRCADVRASAGRLSVVHPASTMVLPLEGHELADSVEGLRILRDDP